VNGLRDALAAHEPRIDWSYQELACSCGWQEPDDRTSAYRGPKDGARDWPDHQRRAVVAALDTFRSHVTELLPEEE
jgi:GrpB-like predicted nucleotidyltransferase (UPF0157 family)